MSITTAKPISVSRCFRIGRSICVRPIRYSGISYGMMTHEIESGPFSIFEAGSPVVALSVLVNVGLTNCARVSMIEVAMKTSHTNCADRCRRHQ